MAHYAWALGDAILFAWLAWEWWSIRRELRRDAAARKAAMSDAGDAPDAKRQQALHPGPSETP